jgi:hypothetical protein
MDADGNQASTLPNDESVSTDTASLNPSFSAFVAQFSEPPLPRGWDTDLLYGLTDTLQPGGASRPVTDLQDLDLYLPDYVFFTVLIALPSDPFRVINDRPSRALSSVFGGCYVMPHAHALLTRNDAIIDCLLLDVTLNTIRHTEDSELHESFYNVFQQLFGIELGQYNVVSDQGSALLAVCVVMHNRHFLCLRHSLLALRRFSDEVGQLVRCRVQSEYERLGWLYGPVLRPPDASLLSRALAKVSHGFTEGAVRQIDAARWEAVSMFARVYRRLPSTSNALESTHGHANERTRDGTNSLHHS